MVGTAYLYVVIPKGFFPVEDTGMISVTVEGPADISFRAMQERQRQIADIIRQDPAVAYLNNTVGVGGPNATNNTGRMFVGLKSKAERGRIASGLGSGCARQPATSSAWQVYFREIQNINLGGRIAKGEFQYTMQSSETETLYKVSDEMLDKIKTIPGLRDVNSDLYIKNPEIQVEIDREKAAFYGISVDQIRQELYNAFGNRQVATIYSPINDYQVILETRPDFQADATGLSKIYLKTSLANTTAAVTTGGGVLGTGTPNGMSIPLSAVTRLVPKVGPLQVNHQGQQPSVTISFNLNPGTSLGFAVDSIHKIERDFNLPLSVTTGFQGNAQVFQESLKGQGVLVLAAVFAAFVVLGILYESFIHPITIISGLPSAGVGALLVLMLFKMELSVIAMIGIVMLVGIVKKNAIMMIDFALERRRVGIGAEAAIREACLLRFRPIMMTTFAAIFGALPIALARGRGRGVAPAARYRGGRRPVRVAAADALHHAGHLPLSRPHRPRPEAPPRAAASGGRAQHGRPQAVAAE